MAAPTATADAFTLTPLAGGEAAILADITLPPAEERWFDPAAWGDAAQPVGEGGRGAAWFVQAPFADALLRQYRRGGLVARISRDKYLWRGADHTRGFAELRLTRRLFDAGLPVPRPLAAMYRRDGGAYRGAILLQRLHGVRSLARLAGHGDAPWKKTGQLIARFHRAGLDHADLNAHNILFDADGEGWLIDFDRGRLRKPSRAWREANLARLQRSLQKLRGTRSRNDVEVDFAQLRAAYDIAWTHEE